MREVLGGEGSLFIEAVDPYSDDLLNDDDLPYDDLLVPVSDTYPEPLPLLLYLSNEE